MVAIFCTSNNLFEQQQKTLFLFTSFFFFLDPSYFRSNLTNGREEYSNGARKY